MGWHRPEARPDFQETTLKAVSDPGGKSLLRPSSTSFHKWESVWAPQGLKLEKGKVHNG